MIPELQLAQEAAIKAAAILTVEYKNGSQIHSQIEKDIKLAADKLAEEAILSTLRASSSLPILSEEAGADLGWSGCGRFGFGNTLVVAGRAQADDVILPRLQQRRHITGLAGGRIDQGLAFAAPIDGDVVVLRRCRNGEQQKSGQSGKDAHGISRASRGRR